MLLFRALSKKLQELKKYENVRVIRATFDCYNLLILMFFVAGFYYPIAAQVSFHFFALLLLLFVEILIGRHKRIRRELNYTENKHCRIAGK